MASTMRKNLAGAVSPKKQTKKKAVPPIDELIVLLIKWIHQPTVTFKLREAFITLWRSNGSQSRVRFDGDLHSSLHQQIINLQHSLFFRGFCHV